MSLKGTNPEKRRLGDGDGWGVLVGVSSGRDVNCKGPPKRLGCGQGSGSGSAEAEAVEAAEAALKS